MKTGGDYYNHYFEYYVLDVSALEYLVQTMERRNKFIRQYDNNYLHITINERSGDCR